MAPAFVIGFLEIFSQSKNTRLEVRKMLPHVAGHVADRFACYWRLRLGDGVAR